MKRTIVILDDESIKFLEKIKNECGMSKSFFIRFLIKKYINGDFKNEQHKK